MDRDRKIWILCLGAWLILAGVIISTCHSKIDMTSTPKLDDTVWVFAFEGEVHVAEDKPVYANFGDYTVRYVDAETGLKRELVIPNGIPILFREVPRGGYGHPEQ